jgi:hypothetical protein
MRYGIILFCGFILLIGPGLAALELHPAEGARQEASREAFHVEYEEKEFRFYPGGTITVTASTPGTLRITGWRKGSIRLEVEKIVHNLPPEKAAEVLNNTSIRIRHDDTSVAIFSENIPESPAMLEVNLTLFVPGDKTDILIRKDYGNLHLDSINGWMEVDIGEGSLDVRSLAGYFSAKLRQGNINAEMSGIRWRGLEFSAMTQQGAVELTLPADYSAAVQLETRDGSVFVDYPPRIVEGESVPPNVVSRRNGQMMRASVGEGGTPIKIGTHSGNVLLSLKK